MNEIYQFIDGPVVFQTPPINLAHGYMQSMRLALHYPCRKITSQSLSQQPLSSISSTCRIP